MDPIPLLINGKNDRQFLLQYFKNNIGGGIPLDRNWCLESLPKEKHEAAKTLLDIVADTLGASARSKLDLTKSFYQLGGNSLNSVYTVTKLRQNGWHIKLSDFLQAKDLTEVVSFLQVVVDEKNGHEEPEDESSIEYPAQMLTDQHRPAVAKMFINIFYEKIGFDQWIMPPVELKDFQDLFDKLWTSFVDSGFSFVVTDPKNNNKLLGVAINFGIYDEQEFELDNKMSIIFEFLRYLEYHLCNGRIPKGKGQVFHSSMMATHESLTPQENVKVIQALEQHCLILSKRNVVGIFTTNTSPLTQQLCLDLLGYESLIDYQVNCYVAENGSRPFGKAPDSERAICCWKKF